MPFAINLLELGVELASTAKRHPRYAHVRFGSRPRKRPVGRHRRSVHRALPESHLQPQGHAAIRGVRWGGRQLHPCIHRGRLEEVEQIARMAQERIVIVYSAQPLDLEFDRGHFRSRRRIHRRIHQHTAFESVEEQKYISDIRIRISPPIHQPRQVRPSRRWGDLMVARRAAERTHIRRRRRRIHVESWIDLGRFQRAIQRHQCGSHV